MMKKLTLKNLTKIGCYMTLLGAVATAASLSIVACSKIPEPEVFDKNISWEDWVLLSQPESSPYNSPVKKKIGATEIATFGWELKTEILQKDWDEKCPDIDYLESFPDLINLKTLEIPNTVKQLGRIVQDSYKMHIENIWLPDSLIRFMDYALDGLGIEVKIPPNILRIGDGALRRNKMHIQTDKFGEPEFRLPDSLVIMGSSAFSRSVIDAKWSGKTIPIIFGSQIKEISIWAFSSLDSSDKEKFINLSVDFSNSLQLSEMGGWCFNTSWQNSVKFVGSVSVPPKVNSFDFDNFNECEIDSIYWKSDLEMCFLSIPYGDSTIIQDYPSLESLTLPLYVKEKVEVDYASYFASYPHTIKYV